MKTCCVTVIMAALAVYHTAQASCTVGDVVIQDGESQLIGCIKYFCKDSKVVDKKDYKSFLCGSIDNACCKKYTQKLVSKQIRKRGCMCTQWECINNERTWLNYFYYKVVDEPLECLRN